MPRPIILHVNTDMDELTSHGVPAHVVPGSCRAFLDLMQEHADAIRAGACGTGDAAAPGVAGENQAGAAALRHRELQPGRRSRFIRRPRLRRCARSFRATASCSSIPARIAPSPVIIGPPTSRAPTSPPPISGRWAGRSRRRSACNARSPDRRVAVITGDGCMQMHGIGSADRGALRPADHLSWCSTTARWAMSGCAPINTVPLPAELTTHSRSRLGGLCALARRAGLDGRGSRAARGDLSARRSRPTATVLIDVKADKNCPTPVYDFKAGARAWSYHE